MRLAARFVLVTCLALTALGMSVTAYAQDPVPVFLSKWGSYGQEDGQFYYPTRLTLDNAGNVYVMDTLNHRVQKFTASGTFVTKWGGWSVGAPWGNAPDGQFNNPYGITSDNAGYIYVADMVNHRIQKFTDNGTFVSKFGSYDSYDPDADGHLNHPQGVAVDSGGNIFVADTYNHRIQKFNASGIFQAKWGSWGSETGQFRYPWAIALDSSDNVYVSDYGNSRIQKFTSDGALVAIYGSLGSQDGQLNGPNGIKVDSQGNVYVADSGNNRVQKFSASGTFLTKWGTEGTGDGQLMRPGDIAIDSAGSIYVADSGNNRIQKFTYTPLALLDNLVDMVEAINLQQGIENSLDSKLQNVINSLNSANAGQRGDAVNKLQAFINSVEAQRGNALTSEQADALIAQANAIIVLLQQ